LKYVFIKIIYSCSHIYLFNKLSYKVSISFRLVVFKIQKMKYLLVFILMWLSAGFSFAQKQANNWYFGYAAALDFNVNPPKQGNSPMQPIEGTACISSKTTGEVIFYTDGQNCQTANTASFLTTFNGNYLAGSVSSTQAVCIIPFPADTNKFYIFTTPSAEDVNAGINATACYSIADMTLNGGGGDIATLNVPLFDTSTEKLCAIGNCDESVYWVLLHKWNSNAFYAYKITAAGIAPPVITNIGSVHQDVPGTSSGSNSEMVGYMKFSPNGKKVGLCTYRNLNTVELFDFDFNTGVLSNPVIDVINETGMDTNPNAGVYGCSFSPDNSKFYITVPMSPLSLFFQYDLSNSNPDSIIKSKTLVGSTTPILLNCNAGGMQIAPNGKIYIAYSFGPNLSVINNPNAKGLACNYVFEGGPSIDSAGGWSWFGLNNLPENFFVPNAANKLTWANAGICLNDSITLTQNTANNYNIIPNTFSTISADSTAITFYPSSTTTFTIISNGLCAVNDTSTATITVNNPPKASFSNTPITPNLIQNTSVQLNNSSTNATAYSWYYNNSIFSTDQNPSFNFNAIGEYCIGLLASNGNACTDSTYRCFRVTEGSITKVYIPTAFSPNGDGINDELKVLIKDGTLSSFSIFNRFGNNVFTTTDINTNWRGEQNKDRNDVGTYYYVLSYKDFNGAEQQIQGDIALIQ
jgi:gliding motility-associated-like protein